MESETTGLEFCRDLEAMTGAHEGVVGKVTDAEGGDTSGDLLGISERLGAALDCCLEAIVSEFGTDTTAGLEFRGSRLKSA